MTTKLALLLLKFSVIRALKLELAPGVSPKLCGRPRASKKK